MMPGTTKSGYLLYSKYLGSGCLLVTVQGSVVIHRQYVVVTCIYMVERILLFAWFSPGVNLCDSTNMHSVTDRE